MAQPEINHANQPPVATGPTDFSSSGDASNIENSVLKEEISRLQSGLKDAENAYNSLSKQLNSLRLQFNSTPPHSSSHRLAPMSRVNGKNSDALRAWFDMAPTYLDAIGMNPNTPQAVLYIVAHFDNPLTRWFLTKKRMANDSPTGGFGTLDELRSACLEFHRGRDPEKLARDKLKSARQNSTVLNFAHYLEDIYLSLPGYSDSAKVHDFIYGLKPHIKEAVQLHEPTSFLSAVRLAQEKESASSRSNSRPQSSAPMDLGILKGAQTLAATSPFPRLTKEERQRLRDSGGCYYCRQLGHCRHECPLCKGSN